MTIDSLTIYCLATGKPIAAINDDETGFILDSLVGRVPVDKQADHLERLALSSMRPSLAWMSVTPESMNHMIEIAPRQVLAYLMNRLYAHIDLDRYGKPLSFESSLAARRMRCVIWDSIESAHVEQSILDQILFALLDLDSRFGLTKLQKPTNIVQLWDSWSADNCDTFLKQLWAWRTTLVTAQEKATKQAKFAVEFWSEGNRMTRNALASTFKKVTPPSVAVAEKREKNAKLADAVDFLTQLERELTGSGGSASEAVAVSIKPTMRFTKFGRAK